MKATCPTSPGHGLVMSEVTRRPLVRRIEEARRALWDVPEMERPTSEEQAVYVQALEALYREVAK